MLLLQGAVDLRRRQKLPVISTCYSRPRLRLLSPFSVSHLATKGAHYRFSGLHRGGTTFILNCGVVNPEELLGPVGLD